MATEIAGHLRAIARVGADHWWHRHRYEIVRSALPQAAQRVLDFGCGSGTFLGYLGQRLPPERQLFGFDPERTAAELNACPRAELLPAWPAPGRQFDAIVTLDVLEHIADDAQAFASLAAALAPGGTLIVTVPAHMALWSKWDEALGHFRRYDAALLGQRLAAAGFVVRRMTALFAFLLPAAGLRRALLRQRPATPEFAVPAAPIHAVLHGLCAAERRLLSVADLPLGTSLLGVATKP